jgi:hypothetical protein
MHNHGLFIWNMASHLVASMSGLVSFLFAFYENLKSRQVTSRAFFVVGMLFLIVACDQAWTDEHNNSTALIAEKSALVQEKNFWKEQSYAKDATLRSRDDLLAKNYTALTGEQTAANQSQSSLAQLSAKILSFSTVSQKTTVLYLDKNRNTSSLASSRFLLLTNKEIGSVKIRVTCDQDVETAQTVPVGMGGGAFIGAVRIAGNSFESGIPQSATWSPTLPLVAEVDYRGNGDIACTFYPHQ